MRKIDETYKKLCVDLLDHGKKVKNTLELRNIKFTLPDITENIISIRDISPSYLFGELMWYFTGRNETSFISKFGSLWEKLSDDGITNNSAYGYLIKKAFNFDQVEKVIELLILDPESRRAVINLNTPNEHVIETRDEPCTIALQFYIRDHRLFCTGMMRSNDIWYGLPYDIVFFTELQKYIADRLNVDYGTYTHFAVSLHVYDKNRENLQNVIETNEEKLITFDRHKFWKNLDFVASLIDVATKHCNALKVRELTLKFAEDNFDYKEIINAN